LRRACIATHGSGVPRVSAMQLSSLTRLLADLRRTKKREAYLEEVGKRNDTPFFAAAFAAVLSTPLIILAVAAANGWLMTPYSLH
jgi:hypothetical protein